jgi:hypothetical protein
VLLMRVGQGGSLQRFYGCSTEVPGGSFVDSKAYDIHRLPPYPLLEGFTEVPS